MFKNSRILKYTASFVLVNLLFQLFAPAAAWALTSGPKQPEFSSFEPINTTDLVNDFNGDFTYNLPVVNIPGPDGSGYAMSLSYHSGVSSEEEASWVGYGWTLNPGAMNRSKRGYPDEFNGEQVSQYNKTRPNWTVSASEMLALEIKSKSKGKADQKKEEDRFGSQDIQVPAGGQGSIKLTASKGIRFNNQRGYTSFSAFGASVNGWAGLSMKRDGGVYTYSATISPEAILNEVSGKTKKQNAEASKTKLEHSKSGMSLLFLKKRGKDQQSRGRSALHVGTYNLATFAGNPVLPFSISEYKGVVYNRDFTSALNVWTRIGVEVGMDASYTIQFNSKVNNKKANGYFYDVHDNGEYDGFSDYYVEKGSGTNKRDRYLGIPFSSADYFNISGDNLSGSFRAFQSNIACYAPNHINSKMLIKPFGLEVGVGVNHIDIGIDVGIGKQFTEQARWKMTDIAFQQVSYSYYDEGNGTSQLRFSNDMGGAVQVTGNTSPIKAIINATGNPINDAFGIINPICPVGKKINTNLLTRSSFIDKTLYKDVKGTDNKKDKSKSFDKFTEFNIPLTAPVLPGESITEFKVIDKSGNTQIYGLPVYTKEELSLSVFLKPGEVPEDNYLVHLNRNLYVPKNGLDGNVADNDYFAGQYSATPYATSHLLTQINTPEYVDIMNDGPTDDDFGGWTKFTYHEWKSSDATPNEWYRYRSPYDGLLYNRGKILDKQDDAGMLTTGQKQMYYLNTTETKTHIAFFVTNKSKADAENLSSIVPGYSQLSDDVKARLMVLLKGSLTKREDGLGAPDFTIVGGKYVDDQAKTNTDNTVHKDINQDLERLEKIVVFSKLQYDKPLQIAHFEYDYSLCKNLPNALTITAGTNNGKLTLKRVWFESEGVYKTKIAPYTFAYNYPAAYDIPKYTALSPMKYSDNPDYAPAMLDAWGSYQGEINGKKRNKNQQGWTNQANDISDFDPAAWNLKRIILPSGGEIHIQYEQSDYQFVQNERAMTLVSLLPNFNDKYDDNNEGSTYYLNLNDLGINFSSLNSGERDAFTASISNYFADKKTIYFKFLYALTNDDANFTNFNSEYIEGYGTVKSVGSDGTGVYIVIGNNSNGAGGGIYKTNRRTTPKYVCDDYYNTNADGISGIDQARADFDSFEDIEASNLTVYNSINDNSTLDNISQNVKRGVGGDLLTNKVQPIMQSAFNNVTRTTKNNSDICKTLNAELSYLKIPVYGIPGKHNAGKKGGGIRVKRLLMYDKGIENGDAALYGSEYKYELADGTSSGVATNEPMSVKEDHTLVNLLDRGHQSFVNRLIAGPDKEQNEGPIGESLLPGASVGYSRVVIQSIHSGASGTGYQVNEYNTCKDFPLTYTKTDLSSKGSRYSGWFDLPTPYFSFSVKKAFTAQGYSFVTNDMHGKPKKSSSFEGSYATNIKNVPLSATEYTYYLPGEQLPVVSFDKVHPDDDKDFTRRLNITGKNLGVEEEIVMESRSMIDEAFDLAIELDLAFAYLYPFSVEIGLQPQVSYNQNQFHSHVTNKVTHFPSTVKSVRKMVNGVSTTEENIAFSNLTGDPLITSVTDAFDGLNVREQGTLDENYTTAGKHNGKYYTYNFPAAWFYSEMGAVGDDNITKNNTNQLTAMAGSVTAYGLKGYWIPDAGNYQGVINASATRFAKDWFTGDTKKDVVTKVIQNDVLTSNDAADIDALIVKLNKIWRPQASYVYKDDLYSDQTTPKNKIYNAGVLKSFEMFPWQTASAPVSGTGNLAATEGLSKKWFLTSQVKEYTPGGLPVEEINLAGIYSAVRYGYYGSSFPTIVAQNATYNSIYFNDFESEALSKQFVINGHSGVKCFDLNNTPKYEFISEKNNVLLTEQLMKRGAIARFWLKSVAPATSKTSPVTMNISDVMQNVPLIKVASVGEWSLYEARITDWNDMAINQIITAKINYINGTNEKVFVDDFRFQPLDAQVVCSVYDITNFKVISQFDDQHFGVFYQYDQEGNLVRKMIETVKGLKTVQENEMNIPKIAR